MPDIGLRAVQGHSTRGDSSLEYLKAAQEQLSAEQEDLPFLCVHGTDHTAWKLLCRPTPSFAVSLPGDHGRIVSGFRTNALIYTLCNLKHWLRDGRDAYRSTNNVICVYETIPLYYVHNVIERHADKELFADDDWHWLKSAVQANNCK